MNISLENYIFLGLYIPLPLSALKVIERDLSHPFNTINNLNREDILIELNKLNKKPGVSISKIPEKALKAETLIKENIFHVISEKIEEWTEAGLNIIPFFDNNYPSRLKQIKNPPKLIFIRGNMDFDFFKAVSIIGTRKPTKYGSTMAKNIAKKFAELGFTIINGFAKGVDTLAIKGGLEAGGKIIGVLGSGLLNVYPKENKQLFHEIFENDEGFFISELLPEKSIAKSTLAVRNRISSALSIGNVFIEGTLKSGTRWQLKYGKEQDKPIIVLKPKIEVEQTQLPNEIIENEKNIFLIEKLDDVDEIAKNIIEYAKLVKNKNKKKEKQRSLTDF